MSNHFTKCSVLSILLMLCSPQAISGVLPQIREALALSQGQVELLGTLPSFTMVLFILFSSQIANRLGMKKTVIGGLLVAGIGGILPVFYADFSTLLLSRLLLGAGLGIYNPLAVRYIGALYEGSQRATLLGWRASTESLGQMLLTLLAGLLLNGGWALSFSLYLLSLPLAILFAFTVPDVKGPRDKRSARAKWNPDLVGFVVLSILLVMNASAISVRFSSVAVELMGRQFQASLYLALMPLFGMLGGLLFGWVYRVAKEKTLFLGLLLLLASNLLWGLFGDQALPVFLGLFLSSIPAAWCFPYLFHQLDHVISPERLPFATSLIFVGCNIGNFLAPLALSSIQILSRNTSLTRPFLFFALLILGTLVLLAWKRKTDAQ